ncbi:hypothetical protein G7070_09960 [Propioniciclava coleopterorum]|uniref:Uncharacterized protein n=1 Tax=Propioniciclava coleopterorum TaxID=2714937 RepID=A0A6G7Y780_9ACTN|nr:hypothetical protein [Propioniciclava coleopterorum]QIK72536.1 hypothetical protein G7070_09960 [Propioniciclava coleopterorum]
MTRPHPHDPFQGVALQGRSGPDSPTGHAQDRRYGPSGGTPAAPSERGDTAGGAAAEGSPTLAAILRAREAVAAADIDLGRSVTAAHDAGHTWQEIADTLGVSRQAAYKRFAHAELGDPTTTVAPDHTPTEAAARDAASLFGRDDLASLRARMTSTCARSLGVKRLRTVRAQIVDAIGAHESIGAATLHHLDGEPLRGRAPGPIVGRVVLHHEEGDAVAHVALNRRGRVLGITVRIAGAPESWPL